MPPSAAGDHAPATARASGTGSGDAPPGGPAVYLITGIPAAGKSTVAQRLAERFPRSAHVRGDLFRRMVAGGRAEMTAEPSPEAVRQLRLRHELTARVIDGYAEAGLTVVAQDNLLGEYLPWTVGRVRSRPLYVIALLPRPEVVAARDRARAKTAYDRWTVTPLDEELRHRTPRLGLWLDTSEQTPEQTVAEILRRAPAEARVPPEG